MESIESWSAAWPRGAYMPERFTKVMDVLVRQTDGQETVERLLQSGFTLITHLAIPGYALQSPGRIEVDVLWGDFPWLEEALAHPERDAAGFPVIVLPYLVLMKMAATRVQDFGDLTTMLGWASDEALDMVRQVVERNSPQDSADLESLIFIGKKEREPPP